MANKIFKFGKSQEQALLDKQKSVVYKDLSMESEIRNAISLGGTSPKLKNNVNVNAVRGALHNIFTWIPGQRILLPEFGSRLYYLLYEGITPQTEERIVAEIRHCVSEWEPRAQIVEIRNVSTVDDTEDNTIHIEVIFTVLGLDDQQFAYRIDYEPTV